MHPIVSHIFPINSISPALGSFCRVSCISVYSFWWHVLLPTLPSQLLTHLHVVIHLPFEPCESLSFITVAPCSIPVMDPWWCLEAGLPCSRYIPTLQGSSTRMQNERKETSSVCIPVPHSNLEHIILLLMINTWLNTNGQKHTCLHNVVVKCVKCYLSLM